VLQKFFEAGLAQPFITKCNANDTEYHLTLTSEVKLKKLLIAGYDRVFEILQSFRNEGISPMHSPEFSLLEIYGAGSDHAEMMTLLEEMIRSAVITDFPDLLSPVDREEEGRIVMDFNAPYKRITFYEACAELLDIPESECDLPHLIEKFPDSFTEGMHRFTWVFKLINKYLGKYLTNPTFITRIPSGISPFVRTNKEDDRVSDRAVLVMNGMDIADVYCDENDKSLVKQAMIRQSEFTGRTHNRDYLELLDYGLPRTASVGLGLNRLFLAFRKNLPGNIKETMLYPIT